MILFFFCRETNEEVDQVKKIINEYDVVSGQRINLEKTEITISSNVVVEKQRELGARLGVRDADQHKKYLGLPTLIGWRKR